MVQEAQGKIRWAQRVPRALIRRLYDGDAAGMLDKELVDEVAYAFLDRCTDILLCTEAGLGRATCPRCLAKVEHTGRKDDTLACACGWTSTWADYHRSYKGRQLHGGTATAFFDEYVVGFDKARTPRERMLLIDRLLNRWHHWSTEQYPTRPAASCLIAGSGRAVVAFLDELSRVTAGRVRVPERKPLPTRP
jgi:hypothetical protein